MTVPLFTEPCWCSSRSRSASGLIDGRKAALETLLVNELHAGLRDAFGRVQAKRKYDANDVAAGREYVKAYVDYIHFVERIHEAITTSAAGHYAEVESH